MNALTKIQAELKAPKNQKNSFGGYNYRSCEDILEAVKPLLKKHDATMTISDNIVEPFDPDLPEPVYREYTSVCPVCGQGYQSEHGLNLTCRACREEPAAGALWGWERENE
jgi:tRNA(Ile2) C34 agmatinyltransferase TiaS